MKFACDVMLGKLARWLRLSGHDVFYAPNLERSGLLRVAREQDRCVLTRARPFRELADIPPYVMIEGDDIDQQLQQVYSAFPQLDPFAGFLTRCTLCNERLVELPPESFQEKVPPKARDLQGAFMTCPLCGKAYWQGTHLERIRARLARLQHP